MKELPLHSSPPSTNPNSNKILHSRSHSHSSNQVNPEDDINNENIETSIVKNNRLFTLKIFKPDYSEIQLITPKNDVTENKSNNNK